MSSTIPRVRAGETITAGHYNLLADAVNRAFGLSAAFPLEIRRYPGGTHVSLARLPKLWLFEITSSTPSTTGDGIRSWDATRVRLNASDVYAPGEPTNVRLHDPGGDREGNVPWAAGQWVWAAHNDDTGRWEIVPAAGTRLRRMELVADLASGAADAKLLVYASGSYSTTGSTFVVHDTFNRFLSAKSGLRGYALFEADRGVWEILALQHRARWVRFQLPAALSNSESSKASCTVAASWDGASPGSTVTVHNLPTDVSGTYVFAAGSGAIGLATYDEVNDKYCIVQMQCDSA